MKNLKTILTQISFVLFTLSYTTSLGQSMDAGTYANSQTNAHSGPVLVVATADVTGASNATDNSLDTYSTLSVFLAGWARQTLSFSSNVSSGSKIYIKLGQNTDLLSLGANVELRFLNSSDVQVGSTISGGSLLGLLSGPSMATLEVNAPGTIRKIEITVSALVDLSGALRIYGAYTAQNGGSCSDPYDVLSGTRGLVSALSGVSDPYDAINDNENDAASLNKIVSAGTVTYVQALFPNTLNGAAHILIGNPDVLISADVLQGLAFNVYNGNSQVGSYSAGNLVTLRLLSGGSKGWITFEPDVSFDRIEVAAGSLVGAVSSLQVYEIKRGPKVTESSEDRIGYKNAPLTIDVSGVDSGTPEWYTSSNDFIASATSYAIPSLNDDVVYYTMFFNACNVIKRNHTINVEMIEVAPQPLNSGQQNVAYSDNLSDKLSGKPAGRSYSFILADGESLPDGLTLMPNGDITGTPTQNVENYEFDVEVTDITDAPNNISAGVQTFVLSITLPISLTEFNVTIENDKPLVSWRVAEEYNVDQYIVQRSIDGQNWIEIHTLEATDLSTYHFIDQNPLEGRVFYRLKITELDRNINYSPIKQLELGALVQKNVSSYPNPSRHQIHIENNQSQVIHLSIYDLTGKVFTTDQVLLPNTLQTFDISSLPSGPFYIRYADPSGNKLHAEIKIKQ